MAGGQGADGRGADGRGAQGRGAGPDRTRLAAGAAIAAWLALCVLFWSVLGGAPVRASGWIGAAVAALLPVALIWAAAEALRAATALREENAALRAANAPRPAHAPAPAAGPARSSPPRTRPASGATFRSVRAAGATTDAPPAPEPAPDAGPEPATDDLVRALHFPESAEDAEGVAALRRVLRSRASARLVQAAQDVLTLMAEDAVYMDEIGARPAQPAAWRAFAAGERPGAAALGEIAGDDALRRVADRMARDAIFRDAAHHFLRQFDAFLARFAPAADDAALRGLAATRTARAFLLLGRAAGRFGEPAPRAEDAVT